jgi:hypothetical protein
MAKLTDISSLPGKGSQLETDNGTLREADQTLLGVLNAMNDMYGWVQVLEVLLDGVIAKYPSGHRYAHYLTGLRNNGTPAQ